MKPTSDKNKQKSFAHNYIEMKLLFLQRICDRGTLKFRTVYKCIVSMIITTSVWLGLFAMLCTTEDMPQKHLREQDCLFLMLFIIFFVASNSFILP